jgi:hypothetical protein
MQSFRGICTMTAYSDVVLIAQAAAIALVFVQGSLFDPLRERGPELWRQFAKCALCVGFWVGMLWTAVARRDFSLEPLLFSVFANGALTAAVALSVFRLWEKLESQAALYDRSVKK